MSLHKKQQSGFTIIELMIAMSVLAVILLISTMTLMQLGKLYSKGVNQANTQNTARNLISSVSSDVQFGSSSPRMSSVGSSISRCFGSTRYTYILSTPLSTTNPHVLWRDTLTSPGGCPALNLSLSTTDGNSVSGSGSELVTNNMSVTVFDANALSTTTWRIRVTIAYGDSDLVVHDTGTGVTTCKSEIGSQYCGVSALEKTVTRRLSN